MQCISNALVSRHSKEVKERRQLSRLPFTFLILSNLQDPWTERTPVVMQVEVLRAVLHLGQFDYSDHLLLNVTACTGCIQFQYEKIKEEALIVIKLT